MIDVLSLSNVDFPEDEFEDSGSQKDFAVSRFATFGVFQLVGRGVKTNQWCGTFPASQVVFVLTCIRELIVR